MDRQKYALETALSGHNILITGQCGTGKTYVLRWEKIRKCVFWYQINLFHILQGNTPCAPSKVTSSSESFASMSISNDFKKYMNPHSHCISNK